MTVTPEQIGTPVPFSQCVPGRIATQEQNGSALPFSAAAEAKCDTHDAFQNGTSMPTSSRGLDDSRGKNSHAREVSQTSTAVEISISDRIRTLAAHGLKVRDISSMLGIHPQLVLLLLDEAQP